ncbi:TolC family protein [Psychromonas sp. psych-6C06]|uniref:TolC family protein n=1 Tax=Psychromonas sp. psych-6C06 TaxID=2058089 RepID=UPI000C335667|nr:TolC family protein [Psychromonas sp. psych-6C06]PKF63370.1 TolC family protein [Psychromonas sp. psych-6C06]
MNRLIFALLFLLIMSPKIFALTLQDALNIALTEDPAQHIYENQQNALMAMGKASATLADPMIKLGMANVPSDSFSLDKDPMTQLSFGLSQQFSRGQSRSIRQKGFNLQSQASAYQAQERRLLVSKTVRELWLNILLIEKSMRLVSESRVLFSSFYDDLSAQFSLGLAENEDLISAEIELGQFDEKIAKLTQQSSALRRLLSEWIGERAYQPLTIDLPKWSETIAYVNNNDVVNEQHYELLTEHPKAKAFKQSVLVAQSNINLAEQDYQPSFKVELGYGKRFSKMDNGESRSDLLSGFVSMDIPLFTDQRQDQKMIAAQHSKGQKQAEYRLLLRQLNAQLSAEIVNYHQLVARQMRYKQSLLKQAKLHSQLLEQSYQSNTRPFKEVIQAYIHELNLSLEYQQLYFDGLKSLATIRYFQGL